MKNGWPTARLDELTATDSPITYGVVKPGNPGDVLFIRGGDLANGRVLHNQLRTITRVVSDQYSRTLLRGGELLMCLVGQPGQVAIAPRALAGANIARQVGLIRLRAEVDPDFICYFLQSPDGQARLGTHTGGSVQQVINLADLRTVNVPVPPLPEQRRIVGILDEAFAGIATAKANAEKNLQNARALFESHLQAVFSQRGEGWVEKKLESVASILNGYAFKSTDFSRKQGVKCIKITNVGIRQFVYESDGDLPDSFAGQYQAVAVKKGSIVLALTRTIIAGGLKFAVVPREYDGALLNQRVASIIANHKVLIGAFLFAYLSTQTVVEYVKERVNTLMQPNLSITDLRSMPIPIPSLREQERITEQIDGLRDETQRLESVYQRMLAALDELKKSLLHQAFSGEL